jgi:phenol/toluene 2-monooxygenase (NADH) P2/A2
MWSATTRERQMAERAPRRVRSVGVDVQDTEENRALIEAIQRDNPDADLLRLPGMVKISTHPQLTIRRSTVEEVLGRPWETNEFQLAIISLSGNIAEWDEDEIIIRWEH